MRSLDGWTMQEVVSSHIKQIAHNLDKSIMEITFHNDQVYHYYAVPRILFYDMLKAKSKGQFLHRVIKGNYTYQKKS